MSSLAVVVGITLAAALLYALWAHFDGKREDAAQREATDLAALGDVVPATLHPVIDPTRCMGSGACVTACPEHGPLAMLQGRAVLVNPLGCIGHGACEAACPAQAITLVFGTKTRGVELPEVDPNFETNQPGIYIAGELGGMGLIRNAVNQGRQAAEHVINGSEQHSRRRGIDGALDALVVGAGPAGISATLRLLEGGLGVLLVDRDSFGGTITHYPRAKVVMTGELQLPLVGRVKKRTMSKEDLVSLWEQIQQTHALPFCSGEVVHRIDPAPDGMWEVHSESQRTWRAANVILALGVRGAPRKLSVPGEELSKVAYRLLEPEEFAGQHVLVVGGGNSAVETALALSDSRQCASVTISYRRDQFARCRLDNRRRIDDAIRAGAVRAALPSSLERIEPDHVILRNGSSEPRSLRNDAVIVQIGGTPPTELLKSFGIKVVTKRGER